MGEAPVTQTHITVEFNRSPQQSVLTKAEVARLLSVPETWVASHSEAIPGTFRLGRNLRFRGTALEEWLGGMTPLLQPAEVADLFQVNTSWIYGHADQIPGVLRLGYYIRFRPAALRAFLDGSGPCQ